MACKFCDIVQHRLPAHIVFEDTHSVGFLDKTPLFPGHVLLVPRQHIETLLLLPEDLLLPYSLASQKVARAVESAMDAEGIFLAINNRISQSVPHLHTHIVPRRKGDGLKGFFWPRKKYSSDDEMAQVAAAIRKQLQQD
jgi:histidine triad (HIT) family protein